MVKNTTGGSKHKGMARKLVNAPISNKIRFSEDDDECYARVVKMLGNGMCHVNLLHKDIICENVVCHIRGKFRSRNKKNNLVSVGSVLLVGIRSWTSKINDCDLLYIYNDNQVSSLHLPSSLNSNSILSNYGENDNNHPDNIIFNDNDNSILSHNNPIDFHLQSSINIHNDNDNDNDIDFDDI